MRTLTPTEETRLKLLTSYSVSVALLEPTATGLKKSILDATGPVRFFLQKNKIHDYSIQSQGQEHKVVLESKFLNEAKIKIFRTSLYRPNTKKGDPRIWFSGLGNFANANDILALIAFENQLWVINLSQVPIEVFDFADRLNPIEELMLAIRSASNLIADELLGKLRTLGKGRPIPSDGSGDTAVGRMLEAALNLPINSSKKPDYKGIELKSFRDKRNNRKNLFNQVPDWNLSKFKSSAEILDNFGYWRDGVFRLYCTVSSTNRNSQGLSLRVDNDLNWLLENTDRKKIGDFVVWPLEQLHERLLSKHNETFWITAQSIFIDGLEHFRYTQAEHTKKPILSQFDLLLEQGMVTVDHLIKRIETGRVNEKGPIFKLNPKALELLFPPSSAYVLI